MSELSELNYSRDWRTPVPLTGKPVNKRIYCWTRRRYIECTCILLGVREIPASVPYAQRQAIQGAGRGRHHKQFSEKE